MNQTLVGIVGGSIGSDPFHRSTWSGITYFLFTEMKRQGFLHRAFGAEVPSLKKNLLMAKNFDRNRARWRRHFYLDNAYGNALTNAAVSKLTASDYEHPLLQIGAMFNMASGVKGKTRCYSYHDGNLVQFIKNNPFPTTQFDSRKVDRAFAYERDVYHGMEKVFTMSEYLRQSMIKDFGVPGERVVSVGAGINMERLPDYNPNKAYDSQEILFIGVEFDRKGGQHLLRAFQGVVSRFSKARLHIVGPRQLTVPEELKAGVTYHGYLSKSVPEEKKTLETLLQKCCLFVMPSLYEPFGIAPLEAMVNQIPAIVTNDWAFREMIKPGVTGDLVARGEADDLEAKLSTYLQSPDRLKEMGDQGRQDVLDRFTWDKVVERMRAAIS